jgi:hypothetical protein
MADTCTHIEKIEKMLTPHAHACEDCVKIGGTWVHLRTCQTCGGTRCCDSSPNHHASKHAHATSHHVVISAEPGERWIYCFADDAYAEY